MITRDQLDAALEKQRMEGGRIGSLLVAQGAMKEEALLDFLSMYFDFPKIALDGLKISREALGTITRAKSKELGVLPLKIVEDESGNRSLMVAMVDPTDQRCLKDVQAITRMSIDPFVTSFGGFSKAFHRCYEKGGVKPKGYENVSTRGLLIALVEALEKKDLIEREELTALLKEMDDS